MCGASRDRGDFREWRLGVGYSIVECARMLQVPPRTVRTWDKGRTRPPYSAVELLRLKTGTALPFPGWEGWMFVNGGLVSPVGDLFTAGGLSWLSLTFEMAREWQRRNCSLAEPTWPDDPATPSQRMREAMAASKKVAETLVRPSARRGGTGRAAARQPPAPILVYGTLNHKTPYPHDDKSESGTVGRANP